MDNKIRTTLVAAAVSSVLTSTAFAASHSLPTSNALPSFDYNVSQARQAAKNAKAPNVRIANNFKKVEDLNKGISRKAKSDHFDRALDVSTFSWATDKQRVAPIPFNVLNRKSGIEQASRHFAQAVGAKHGVTASAIEQSELKYVHDTGRGGLISKYQQRANGIEVHERQFNVLLNQQMELVATTGYFSKAKLPMQPLGVQFKVPATDAINVAIKDMGGDEVGLSKSREQKDYQFYKANEGEGKFSFTEDPRSKRVYYPGTKQLMPAYYVEIMASEKGSTDHQAYRYVISAKDGSILSRHSLSANEAFTYKVFADDQTYIPFDSPMGNDLTPHPTGVETDILVEVQATMNDIHMEHAGISTGDAWLPAGATETTGNNVNAYADITAPSGFNATVTDSDGNEAPGDVRAHVTSEGVFDYQFTQTDAHDTEANMNAAVVNLFYVNNYLHDIYYDHGFDEAAGNAQVDNYGRGGVGGDPLNVEGQDYGGVDNANMATPADGSSPRMQMYLWIEGASQPLSIGTLENVAFQDSSFSPIDYNLSGTLVQVVDGTDPTSDGCETPVNAADLAGNIAIIDRGACDFTQKVSNAQDAGAIGVIVANNDAADPDNIFTMSAGDNAPTITIPALMISYNDGVAVYEQMAAGPIEANVASNQVVRDGTFDNPIVEHEWGHYISNRLTHLTMYNNNQGRSMGEGWGDFFALMTMVREEDQQLAGNDHWQGVYNDGGYAVNNGFTEFAYYYGLRRAPYSTNMDVNPLTFKHIEDQVALPENAPLNASAFGRAGGANAEVHNAGEIWAVVLWDAYAALLNREGKTFAQSQSDMMDYIVAGMKITPASPTYTEGRDAVLAVALANSVDDYHLMRAAFAKRGMGPGAVSPDRADAGYDGTGESQGHVGVEEDFEIEHSEVELTNVVLDNQYVGLEGAFCDNDGILDVGETSAVHFSIRNHGTYAQQGIKVMVSSRADVTFANDGEMEFDEMPFWNDTAMGLVEMKLNSADTDTTIPIHITFMAEDEGVRLPADIDVEITVNRDIEKDDRRTVEDFENMPAVWADWSQHKIGPADSGHFVGLDDWTVIDVGFGTGNTMMGPDGRVSTDISLMSPMITVGASGEFAMDFSHYYEFEVTPADGETPAVYWDGGVMEISVDGGEWTDVIDAGGSFSEDGGYTGVLLAQGNQALSDRNAFVDLIPSAWLTPERITFPDGAMNGHNVQFRFRIGTDGAAGAWGWNLDDVSFTNATNATFSSIVPDSGVCVNRPPAIGTHTQEVTEAEGTDQTHVTLSVNVIDHDDPELNKVAGPFETYEAFAAAAATNDDDFTYSWAQTSGPSVSLDDMHSATPSFETPIVGEDTSLWFSVEVSDGQASSTASVGVKISNVNSAPVVNSITGPEEANQNMEVTLIAHAMDPEGDALTYTWMQTGGTSAEISGTTDHLTFHTPQVADDEMLTFSAVASDGEYSSEAASYSFMVKGNTAPTLTADSASVNVDEKKSVNLSVTGVDSDGDELTYIWMVDGVQVNNSGSSYSYIAPSVPSDTVKIVTVTASDAEFTTDPVTISVNINNTSSGAGMGLMTLLLAPLAFIRRRKQK